MSRHENELVCDGCGTTKLIFHPRDDNWFSWKGNDFCPDCEEEGKVHGEWSEKNSTAAASLLGRKGGLSKSPRKQASSRQNGKKGGRPAKKQGE